MDVEMNETRMIRMIKCGFSLSISYFLRYVLLVFNLFLLSSLLPCLMTIT